jgi:hypothetical protein
VAACLVDHVAFFNKRDVRLHHVFHQASELDLGRPPELGSSLGWVTNQEFNLFDQRKELGNQ